MARQNDSHPQAQAVSTPKTVFEKLSQRAFAPLDIASLVVFRIAFGLLMAWNGYRFLALNRILHNWIEPKFLFKYYGFSWVQPWPDRWLYLHWEVMLVLAFFIAAGFLYRVSIALFFLSYTYFFLLDASIYVNHNYLVCLVSFLLIFIPANRAFSIDALLWPKMRADTVPAWTLWILRFQMGAVYFFAGIAKMTPDWFHAEPIRTWLHQRPDFLIFGKFSKEEWFAYAMSYGALCFDTSIAFFLLWRRTRLLAFCVATAFHLLNTRLFNIGFFPWLAITATTLFLSPNWPRRVASLFRIRTAAPSLSNPGLPPKATRVAMLTFLACYAFIQIVLPLRRFMYSGGIEWTYVALPFGWEMMACHKEVNANFYVTDPNTGETRTVRQRQYLRKGQERRVGWRPALVVQFAHFLAANTLHTGPKPPVVETRMFVSVNGRKPRMFLDQNVNLAVQSIPLGRPPWLLRVDEPLPPPGQRFSANPYAVSFEMD